MALTSTQIAKKLFKRLLGKGDTNTDRAFYEEPYDGRNVVYPDQVWKEKDAIPESAPTGLSDGEVSGVVERVDSLTLSAVSGVNNSFYHSRLKDFIPFNFGDGSYNYTIKDSSSNIIAFGQGDWILDTSSGVLTFYGSVPANMPPVVSGFRYVGAKGIDVTGESEKETADRTIYVDSVNGSDDNGGTATDDAFATLEKGILNIKKQINVGVTVTIDLAAGDYTLTEKSVDRLNGLYWYGRLDIIGKMEVIENVDISQDSNNKFKSHLDTSSWVENQYSGYFVEWYYDPYYVHKPIPYNDTNSFYCNFGSVDGNINIIKPSVSLKTEKNSFKKFRNPFLGEYYIRYTEEGDFNIKQLDFIFDTVTASNNDFYSYNSPVVFKSTRFRKQLDGNKIDLMTSSYMYFFCIFYSEGTNSDDYIRFLIKLPYNIKIISFVKIANKTNTPALSQVSTKSFNYEIQDIFVNNYDGVFTLSNMFLQIRTNIGGFYCDCIFRIQSYSNIQCVTDDWFLILKGTKYLFIDHDEYNYTFIGRDTNPVTFLEELPQNSWSETYHNDYINIMRKISNLPGVYPEEDLRNNETLTANTSGQVLTVGDKTQNMSIEIHYTLERSDSYGTYRQKGEINILNKTDSLVFDPPVYIGDDVGINFSSQFNGDLIELVADVDDAYGDAVFQYDIYRIML